MKEKSPHDRKTTIIVAIIMFVLVPAGVYLTVQPPHLMEKFINWVTGFSPEQGKQLAEFAPTFAIGFIGIAVLFVISPFLIAAVKTHKNHKTLMARGMKDYAEVIDVKNYTKRNPKNGFETHWVQFELNHHLPIIKRWNLAKNKVGEMDVGDKVQIIYDPLDPKISNLIYVDFKIVVQKKKQE